MIFYNVIVRPIVSLTNSAVRMYYRRDFWKRIAKSLCVLAILALVVLCYKRHGKQSLLWYDKMYESLTPERLNIAIVEEHHEVLPYWFAASHKGYIPAHGNILIHIDAHPDTFVPAYDSAISKFNSPQTAVQIQLLMQRNDVFITGAAYKDLISTVIWIYPDWVDVSDFGGAKYAFGGKINLKLGFYDVYVDGALVSGFCVCYEAGDREDGCDFVSKAGALMEDFKGQCSTYRVIFLYLVKASSAAERLPELLDTFPSPSSILLDIDEDFYGVMKGSELLADVDFKLIEAFNELLASTFTVLNINDEGHAHSLLENILHMIKVTCQPEREECSREDFRKIQRFLTESGQQRIPIGKKTIKSNELQQLVTFISTKFTKQHLDQLVQTGFCLRISPLTYKLNVLKEERPIAYETITVCHGINVPGMDNQIHLPTSSEVDKTTDVLDSILEVVSTDQVKLVTVARSNRDGFTPRHFQQKIEESILLALRKKFIDSDIIFDRNLMLHLGQGIPSDLAN